MPHQLHNAVHIDHRWIDELRSPECYPHTVDGDVSLIETHISWIVLAGRFAYKIKKPVRNDFLDYSSLEKRHRACCEELRIGNRFAPELYLDVVPICREENQLCMDGDSQPFEFAVRMRRFSSQDLLSDTLAESQFTQADAIQLAQTIAQLHLHAPHVAVNPEAYYLHLKTQSENNFHTLRLDPLFTNDSLLPSLETWTSRTLDSLRSTLHHRCEDHFIRECHGDLHCNNIVRWKNRWTPFDGIEFNRELSEIDTLNDIAFLAMDLRCRNAASIGDVLLNAYLEVTGDYHHLLTLRWYSVYRAMVRSKVASMQHCQLHDSDATAGKTQLDLARRYLQLADELTRPTTTKLAITHGLSGSGKTTGSFHWLQQNHGIRLRSDVERKRLFQGKLTRRNGPVDDRLYTSSATETTYNTLRATAKEILNAGYSVIVDATFLNHRYRDLFRNLATEQNVSFEIVDFQADIETLRSRIVQRQHQENDASDADIEVLERQIQTEEPLSEIERTFTIEPAPPT